MTRWRRAARACWTGLALVAGVALTLQFVLVLIGVDPLLPESAPSRALAALRFFAYFTIQSNLAVLLMAGTLARRPDRDGPGWRVLRSDALVGITVTGLVHWFLLRPLLDLHGLSALCDTLLHVVVPLLAVAGYLVFGPRCRTSGRTVGLGLIWPLAWSAVIITQGWFTRWFPYPFLDVHVLGARVIAYVLAIAALFVALFTLLRYADRRLPDRFA